MSADTTPKFMKDETGFCYVYTDLIASQSHLTPHDGDVDENGFAVEAKAKHEGKKKAAE